MEDKYYVPKIEEFHVGFEFEETPFIGGYKLTSNPIWHKVIYQITEKAPLSTIESMIHFKRARVKYLDKEDIESLGFTQTIEDQYYKDDFELLIDDDLFIQIIKDDGFIFQGTIKNKSEFKKLLIQTGIINE